MLRQKQSRSLLTVLGLIFGVGCTTLLINLGLGVQRQLLDGSIFKDNVVTIRSGQTTTRTEDGQINRYNFAQTIAVTPTLTTADLATIQNDEQVAQAAPIMNLNQSIIGDNDKHFANGHVLATNASLLPMINYELKYGSNVLDGDKATVIIGDEVAKELFNNSRPISYEINLNDQTYIVVGVLDQANTFDPLGLGFNYRRAVLVPFQTATQNLAANQLRIYEILAQTTSNDQQLVANLERKISQNHNQKRDFSVFRNSELLFLTDYSFNLARQIIIGISIIFLFIGGIGIMNAMNASIAERRLEIKLRKIFGATNQQIVYQFLTEALVLSLVGGMIGICLALLTSFLVDYATPIEPVIQLDVIGLMLILTVAIGFIFGSRAAIQAALQPVETTVG